MQNNLRIYFMHTQMCPPFLNLEKQRNTVHIHMQAIYCYCTCFGRHDYLRARMFYSIRPSRRSHQRYERDTENHIGVGSVSFDHAIAG